MNALDDLLRDPPRNGVEAAFNSLVVTAHRLGLDLQQVSKKPLGSMKQDFRNVLPFRIRKKIRNTVHAVSLGRDNHSTRELVSS